jgi:hypothetical protein
MFRGALLGLAVTGLAALALSAGGLGEKAPAVKLPKPGNVIVDKDRGEVILSATVQHPTGKPCIDDFGQRIQAFVGCGKADGQEAKMAGYFVFLVDVPTEKVYQALVELGAKTKVSYSMEDGHRRSGLKTTTKPDDYLQGDPVILSVFWKDGKKWVERPYQSFVRERVLVEGKATEKPWTPSFVFHGSGAIHRSGTGCIACPCDCAGGIIADNRFPLYNPKPVVCFDLDKAPKAGTAVYVRIRVIGTR